MESNYQKFVMLGCRLGYIVRSQMSEGNVEIPDGVLISSDGYILTDCNGVYLIAAADAEPDEPEVPDEPGEVATMYLYGTPSESGNIGLRVGDTVTYYNGFAAPDINTVYTDEMKTEYPYARIGVYGSTYRLSLVTVESTVNDSGATSFLAGVVYEVVDGKWAACSKNYNTYTLIWANYNVRYANSNELYLAKSDPIPVGEIVDYIDDIPIYERKDA